MNRKIQIRYNDSDLNIFNRTINYINPNITDSIATDFVTQTISLTDNNLISSNIIDTRELDFSESD